MAFIVRSTDRPWSHHHLDVHPTARRVCIVAVMGATERFGERLGSHPRDPKPPERTPSVHAPTRRAPSGSIGAMPQPSAFRSRPSGASVSSTRNHIDLTERGVAEDRRFYLADDTNRLVDKLVVPELSQICDPHRPGRDVPADDLPGRRCRRGRGPPDRSHRDPDPRPHGRRPRRRRTVGGATVRIRRPPITSSAATAPAGHVPAIRSASSVTARWRNSPAMPSRAPSTPVASGCSSSSRAPTSHEEDTWIGGADRARRARAPDHQARCPLRDDDPEPRHRRARPRHPPDDHQLPRAARGQARRPGRAWRRDHAGDASASATRSTLLD